MKAVLFDLDGTLLPMDQDRYLQLYMGYLSAYMSKFGYEPKEFIKNLWACTEKMVRNDGKRPNCEIFWDGFAEIYGRDALRHKETVDAFYSIDYARSRAACGFSEHSAEIVNALKAHGITVAVATSPLFPRCAIEQRISWAGLSPDDFALVTTYENSCYSKPNPVYYAYIAKKLGLDPADCVMVGNDVSEDMPAAEVGMEVFLLTDCLINSGDEDIEKYPHGSYGELKEFLGLI